MRQSKRPGDMSSIPGLERSLGEGNGNPLQYSFLGNPTDRGAWQATVHGVAKESNTTERLNDNTRLGPSWWDWCSCELKAIPESSFSLFLCHEREEEDVTVCKPERELSLESNHAGTLILDFQSPELWENKPWLFIKSPVHGILLWQPKLRQAGKDWAQEEKVATQDKMV